MSNFERWDGKDVVRTVTIVPEGGDRFLSIVAHRNSSHKLFGGQLMGLALQAASATVQDRAAQAVSGFFVRGGSIDAPVELSVERVFDGGSFSHRRVVAHQSCNRLFDLYASFQAEEPGVEHADVAPDVPPPETLAPLSELLPLWRQRLPEGVGALLDVGRAVDLRPIDPAVYFGNAGGDRRRVAWVRVPSAASAVSDATHRSILAYLTDYWLAQTALLPHAGPECTARYYLASLNQTMWFHRPCRVDEWLLIDCDSPSAQNGRGIGRSLIFDRQGRLAASAAQEVLIRARALPGRASGAATRAQPRSLMPRAPAIPRRSPDGGGH